MIDNPDDDDVSDTEIKDHRPFNEDEEYNDDKSDNDMNNGEDTYFGDYPDNNIDKYDSGFDLYGNKIKGKK